VSRNTYLDSLAVSAKVESQSSKASESLPRNRLTAKNCGYLGTKQSLKSEGRPNSGPRSSTVSSGTLQSTQSMSSFRRLVTKRGSIWARAWVSSWARRRARAVRETEGGVPATRKREGCFSMRPMKAHLRTKPTCFSRSRRKRVWGWDWMRELRWRIMDGFLRSSITLSSSGTLWYVFFFGLLPPLDFCLMEKLAFLEWRNGTPWRSIAQKRKTS